MENLKALTLAALIAGTPVLAMADFTVGDTLGTTEAEIRAAVEPQGYTVEEIEFEDGEIEVEVLMDGVETELELDELSGRVTEVEIEDEDDHGDDDDDDTEEDESDHDEASDDDDDDDDKDDD